MGGLIRINFTKEDMKNPNKDLEQILEKFRMWNFTKSLFANNRFDKINEFYDTYWPKFIKGLESIDSNKEFNNNYLIVRFNKLPEYKQDLVLKEMLIIYISKDKVTYKQFNDIMEDKYVNEKEPIIPPPNDAA